MLHAGLQNPEHIYAGLTGDPEGLLSAEEASELQLQPPLPLREQVLVEPCQAPDACLLHHCVLAITEHVCSIGCNTMMFVMRRWRSTVAAGFCRLHYTST